MVIFNSYVKLPEGTLMESRCGFAGSQRKIQELPYKFSDLHGFAVRSVRNPKKMRDIPFVDSPVVVDFQEGNKSLTEEILIRMP